MLTDQEKILLKKRVYAIKDIVYSANPNIDKGESGLIVGFSMSSRNPCVQWDNGSRGYVELNKDIYVEYEGSLKYILDNLLSSIVKAEDAPCSSYTHWAQAIDALYKMAGDYIASTDEHKEELAQALEHMRLLRGD